MRSTFKVLFYLKRNKDKDQKVVPVMGRIKIGRASCRERV